LLLVLMVTGAEEEGEDDEAGADTAAIVFFDIMRPFSLKYWSTVRTVSGVAPSGGTFLVAAGSEAGRGGSIIA